MSVSRTWTSLAAAVWTRPRAPARTTRRRGQVRGDYVLETVYCDAGTAAAAQGPHLWPGVRHPSPPRAWQGRQPARHMPGQSFTWLPSSWLPARTTRRSPARSACSCRSFTAAPPPSPPPTLSCTPSPPLALASRRVAAPIRRPDPLLLAAQLQAALALPEAERPAQTEQLRRSLSSPSSGGPATHRDRSRSGPSGWVHPAPAESRGPGRAGWLCPCSGVGCQSGSPR